MTSVTMQQQFDEQIAASRSTSDSLLKRLNAKEDAEAAQAAADVRTASIVLSAMSKIPVPKDGKDGKDAVVDYEKVTEYIDKRVEASSIPIVDKAGHILINGKDGKVGPQGPAGITEKVDYSKVKTTVTEKVKAAAEELHTTLDAKVLKSVAPISYKVDKLSTELSKVTSKLDTMPKATQPKPVKGKEGARGKKGDVGVGIKDITTSGDSLTLELTDGSKRSITIPNRSVVAAPALQQPIQRAVRVPYDSASSKLGATTVQEAIDILAGTQFAPNTAARFMETFNNYEDTHSSDFVYNAGGQLISKTITDGVNSFYLVTFTYVTGVLTEKLITDLVNNDSVEIVFEYVDDLLTRKLLTYNR